MIRTTFLLLLISVSSIGVAQENSSKPPQFNLNEVTVEYGGTVLPGEKPREQSTLRLQVVFVPDGIEQQVQRSIEMAPQEREVILAFLKSAFRSNGCVSDKGTKQDHVAIDRTFASAVFDRLVALRLIRHCDKVIFSATESFAEVKHHDVLFEADADKTLWQVRELEKRDGTRGFQLKRQMEPDPGDTNQEPTSVAVTVRFSASETAVLPWYFHFLEEDIRKASRERWHGEHFLLIDTVNTESTPGESASKEDTTEATIAEGGNFQLEVQPPAQVITREAAEIAKALESATHIELNAGSSHKGNLKQPHLDADSRQRLGEIIAKLMKSGTIELGTKQRPGYRSQTILALNFTEQEYEDGGNLLPDVVAELYRQQDRQENMERQSQIQAMLGTNESGEETELVEFPPRHAKPADVAKVLNNLQSAYVQAERQSAQIAMELRELRATGKNTLLIPNHIQRLRESVQTAFDVRMNLQQAQLTEAEADLKLARERLARRQQLADKIIDRRVQELQSGEDTSWPRHQEVSQSSAPDTNDEKSPIVRELRGSSESLKRWAESTDTMEAHRPNSEIKPLQGETNTGAATLRFGFNFSNTPWMDVLSYLADTLSLPVNVQEMPTGGLSLLRSNLTADEAIDELNRKLAAQFLTIQRTPKFLIVKPLAPKPPADPNANSAKPFFEMGEGTVRGTGKVVAFGPDTSQRAVELWISGNDIPMVQRGDHVRLHFEGWPAVPSDGAFGGEVMTNDPTADTAGNFRILIKPDAKVPWPDKRYLRPGVRANCWVFTGSRSDTKSGGNRKQDAKEAGADSEESAKSGLVAGQFGGFAQTMQIDPEGGVSYSDAKSLCQMTLFEDDRLTVAFPNNREIWTDVTLPLVTGAAGHQRAVWSAELDGCAYRVTAIPFSTRGCLFRLEKRQDDKLIHGSLQFFAVKSKRGNAEHDAPVVPIDNRQWRVDQTGTGIVAGHYTGASQRMQIADDGSISYSDRAIGICHLAVLADDRLTAAFRNASGIPKEITLPLVNTATEQRASWSDEVDGHTLRATAIPYSDNVYVFRLEKYLDGKLIEGEEQFYALDQKLRKATPEERAAANAASHKTPINKTSLRKVSSEFQPQTTVLKGLVSGSGVIERIEGETIHLRSGDAIVVPAGTMVLQPTHGEPPIPEYTSDQLEPGMAIAYSLRDGKIERKLMLLGIVEQVPSHDSAFDKIKSLDLRKGNEMTHSSVDGKFSMRLAGSDGEATIKIGETKLIRLPAPTESIQWRVGEFKPDGIDDIEPPVVVDNRVFVGAADGRLYALNLATGDEVWQYEVRGGFVGSAGIADNRLVIANDEGTVFCFGEER